MLVYIKLKGGYNSSYSIGHTFSDTSPKLRTSAIRYRSISQHEPLIFHCEGYCYTWRHDFSASFGLVATFSHDLEYLDPYLEWVDLLRGRRNGKAAGIND